MDLIKVIILKLAGLLAQFAEMTNDNSRYSGPPTVQFFYMKEFAVECPRCKRDALVTTGGWNWEETAKLTCANCMHAEKAADLVRYKLIVKRHCDNCGKEFETVIPDQKEKVEQITLPCPHCGVTRTYEPRNDKYLTGYKVNGKATDPIFGLPLWFQADVRGDLFWAYNRDHLKEIKSYVASKLRERQTNTHTTMVERLPNFIKDSKNRERIVKVIERLEKKMK